MKKLFTLITAAAAALAMTATTYTGQLIVTVNGSATELNDVNIDVTQSGDLYTMSINNFKLNASMGVGNIVLEDVTASTTEGITMMGVSRDIIITAGDEAGIASWLGPELGFVPINMIATISEGVMVTDIDIEMASLNQTIHVHFTSDVDKALWKKYQMPNSDFEETTSNTTEPRYWHGFESCTGSYSSESNATVSTSSDVRPGTKGTKSALINSNYYLVSPVNGTMTNGRLSADSMTAADSRNNSHMQANSSETDKNGDPFFMSLAKEPDAIKAWVKYTQQTETASWYATISAITYNTNVAAVDGKQGYLQDPEPKKAVTSGGIFKTTTYTGDEQENYYKNVAAKAQKRNIPAGDWTEYTVNFDYDNTKWSGNNVKANAILVTVSTNAKAGTGSSKTPYDKVFVDDMELVYNASISNIALSGIDLEGFSFDKNVRQYNLTYDGDALNLTADNFKITTSGRSAIANAVVGDLGDGNYQVAICAVSPDMVNNDLYIINIKKLTPLAEIVDGENEALYNMKEEAKVAYQYLNDQTFELWQIVTDGTNWIKVYWPLDVISMVTDENILAATSFNAASISGTLSNVDTNPVLTLTAVPSYTIGEQFTDLATYDLASSLKGLVPNQMATFKGYIDNYGKLRGYNTVGWGTAGGQSLDIDNLCGATFTPGARYSVTGIVNIKEAWSNQAPRHIAADDNLYFQNYTIIATEATKLDTTGIDNIDATDQSGEVRYIDLMGRTHTTPVAGVNIIVRNGKATKVIY